ncbi:transposase [Priestia sp. YIM B13489]|uniref:transposase n=1 Tax=Priestia sp. YIM B13489 TaxID=3366313 RepID=UPI003670DFDF
MGDGYYVYSYGKRLVLLGHCIGSPSQKIVTYSFSPFMTLQLVIEALQNACFSQKSQKGLIVHTDFASQYTRSEFTQHVPKHGIRHSFSQKDCPYDNACIESFHAILKKEEVYRTQYANYRAVKLAVFQFIETWYN